MLHCYDSEVAKIVGIPAAAIFHNIAYWIFHNETNGTNIQQGEFWTYNSAAAFSEQFPELTQDQVRRALEKLRDAGFIKVGHFNKNRFDRTSWYAIGENGRAAYDAQFCRKGFAKTAASITKNGSIHSANLTNGYGTDAGPIPNSTHICTQSNSIVEENARIRTDTPPSLAKAEEEDNAAVDEMTLHGQYPETWEEVKAEAVRFGIEMQQDEAEAFLAKYASVGWLNKFGHKITNWRILLKTWHNNWEQIEKDKNERATGGKNGCYIRGSAQGVRDPYIEGRFNVEGDGYESNDWERFFGKGDNPGDGEKRNDEAGS